MPNRFIYAFQAGGHDRSRWLTVTEKKNGDCVLHLQDLCMPGRVSVLSNVICPAEFLRSTVEGSALQITTGTGFLLLRQMGDLMNIEFRGLDDVVITKASVKTEELRARVKEILDKPLVVAP